MYRGRTLVVAVGLVGCGPVVAQDGDTGSTTFVGGEATAGTTTPGTMSTSATTGPGTTSPSTTTTATTVADTGSGEVDTGSDFIAPFDIIRGGDCDLWTQDCPRGEKCMPWANDGGTTWNAVRCTEIARDPKSPGEPCTVEGSAVSGIDDCVLGAMCWNVDAETNMGECVAFCEGSRADPSCAGECAACQVSNEGVLPLCLPICDPIAQDCGPGDGCYADNTSFSCLPDASGEAGAVGDPCEFLNVCDPGSACVPVENLAVCEGASGCCSPFCDVADPGSCEAVMPGTTCVPWFAAGRAPPDACVGGVGIGVCALPQ